LIRHATRYPGIFYVEVKRAGRPGMEKLFYARYKDPRTGKKREAAIGRESPPEGMTAHKAALRRAELIEGKRKPQRDLNREKREAAKVEAERWTIQRLWDEYKGHLSGKTFAVDKNRYEKWIKPHFDSKEPSEIAYLDVEKLKRSMLKKKAPQTVKHVLTLITRIVNFGVKRGLCAPLPFRIQGPKVNNLKTEDLSDEQLDKLMVALDADPDQSVANVMRLALFTGMRRGELLRLQWQDVNFQRGFIAIKGPKGGRDQIIPMNDAARAVLEAQGRSDSPYVFPGRSGGQRVDIKRPIERIRKAAGLPKDFRPLHGLRHAYASMLASSGQVDLYVLQRLLTHKSPQMTQRYAHLRDEALKRAADVAGDYFGGRKEAI
jgi:integrase